MQKEILLFTSKDIIDTGSVSYKYLLSIDGAYSKYEHCRGLWGYIHKDGSAFPFNLFQSAQGLQVAGAFGQGDFDNKNIEALPEKCSMLCSVATADSIEKILEGKVKIIRLLSEEPLRTS